MLSRAFAVFVEITSNERGPVFAIRPNDVTSYTVPNFRGIPELSPNYGQLFDDSGRFPVFPDRLLFAGPVSTRFNEEGQQIKNVFEYIMSVNTRIIYCPVSSS